ncbi:MAG: glycosyltransferase family 2 protein [Clostridia bacterium]|nr:glycosyltransferase family 2 protein [Clostridia bacterium]
MISVIVPVYHVEPYLRQCVDSILDQTYRDIEILLIEDGSPDRCGEICDEYGRNDDRVKVYHTENRGLAAARNLGLREAAGEYIGFVDSDDWIEADMYEVLLRLLEKTGADVSVCDFIQEPVSFKKDFYPVDTVLHGTDTINALFTKAVNYTVWNKLYRREIFRGILFPDGKNYEDVAAMHRIMHKASGVAVIPAVKYHYRIRDESITKIYSAKNLMDYADAYLESYGYLSTELSGLFSDEVLLQLPAKGISKVWRWWYGCSSDEKREYAERIKELVCFARKHFPTFGYRSWPGYLRLSALFMHYNRGMAFALMYGLNQAYRKIWPEKGNAAGD